MRKRSFFTVLTAAACSALPAWATAKAKAVLQKSQAEWQKIVSPAAFQVLFGAGTERPGSSPLNTEKRPGTYVCAACNLPLFEAAHKFDSGTGWPSFWQPIAASLGTSTDFSLIFPRTEYHCARCGGHQGQFSATAPNPLASGIATTALRWRLYPKGKHCQACEPEQA